MAKKDILNNGHFLAVCLIGLVCTVYYTMIMLGYLLALNVDYLEENLIVKPPNNRREIANACLEGFRPACSVWTFHCFVLVLINLLIFFIQKIPLFVFGYVLFVAIPSIIKDL